VFCAGMDLSALGQFNEGQDDPGDPAGPEALAAFMEGSYPKP
jgi:enoyl-CoA hydratase/carnithine racemase